MQDFISLSSLPWLTYGHRAMYIYMYIFFQPPKYANCNEENLKLDIVSRKQYTVWCPAFLGTSHKLVDRSRGHLRKGWGWVSQCSMVYTFEKCLTDVYVFTQALAYFGAVLQLDKHAVDDKYIIWLKLKSVFWKLVWCLEISLYRDICWYKQWQILISVGFAATLLLSQY